jgi:hypothetical protein
LSFHVLADDSMVVLSLQRRTGQTTKRSQVTANTFDIERMLPRQALADGILRDLYDAVFRAHVTHPATIRDYVEWAHGAVCRELAHDERWKGPRDEDLEALGFEPLWVAFARNLPHPPGLPAASLEAYNHVARHAREFETLLDDDEDAIALYSIFCDSGDFPAAGEPVARLRVFLRSRGLSSALWRSIARGECDPLASLDPELSRAHNAAQCMRILKLVDRIGPEYSPPSWLIRALLAIGFPYHDANLDLEHWRAVALARRVAVLHSRADDDTRRTMAEMLPTVLDWFDENRETAPRSLRRMSWHTIARMARAHGERREAARRNLPVPFERLPIEGYEITSLSSAAALLDEGSSMHHCVANYVARCVRGGFFVCSIRKRGDPAERWTASFFLRQGRWHLEAITGRANAPAGDRARAIAALVLAWLDDQNASS